jgi:hypothetical protein
MPRLIRRLIHATAEKVYRVGFPADESTQLGGYDGIVQVTGGLPHAPDGQSAWELGVNKAVKDKADDDYEKRKKTPGEVNPKDTTFVFVTPRRWGGKEKWVTARRKEAFWRDVWALDADDLEQWLEQAHAVAVWLGRLIGKRFDGATDLQETWESWSQRTQPPVSADFLMAGRTQAKDDLARWLDTPPTAVCLRSSTTSEAVAFFAAFALTLPVDRQVALLARTVVVSSATALARLRNDARPLVIIPDANFDSQPHLAVRNRHHVLLPVGPETPDNPQDIRLPMIPRSDFENGLRVMGLDENRARAVARESRGQLSILIRLLGRGPAAIMPPWASPVERGHIAPLLLAGAWDRNRPADRIALERLVGVKYLEIESLAVRWHSTSDSPLRLTGSVWEWISRDDGWYHISNSISPTLLDNFEQTALDVLGTPDPRYTMPPDQRWAANVQGKVQPHSAHLRESLAHSLALLAVHSTVGVHASGNQPRVDLIVRRLLGANDGPKLWPSLSQLLPLLAEAAPDAFLDCLEEEILRDEPALLSMFEEEGSSGSSPHTGMLWALENLAWSPTHLSRVTVVLGRLAAHDPGGSLANRPIATLREIFLLWLPRTKANLSQRLQVIDVLQAREPGIAWDLCTRLLPQGGEISTGSHTPRWRALHGAGSVRVTIGELRDGVSAITDRLLAWVGTDGKRWAWLLRAMGRVQRAVVKRLIQQLRQFAGSTATAENRLQVWHALRGTLNFQRQVLEPRKGRLPVTLLSFLDRIYDRLAPTDVRSRVAWLFTSRPYLPDFESNDSAKEREAIEEARRQAIDAVNAAEGTEGLLRLIDEAEQPWTVGWTVGSSAMTETQLLPLLETCLDSADGKRTECGRGLVMARRCQAVAWPTNFFSTGPGNNWPLERRVAFARGLPGESETWDLVASWGAEAKTRYWRSAVVTWLEQPVRDAERCINALLSAGRPWTALKLVGMFLCGSPPKVPIAPGLVLTVLDTTSRTNPASEPCPVNSDALDVIDGVLKYLETSGKVDDAKLAELEWTFLPVLRQLSRGSPVLHRMLAKLPEMFVEALAAAFRSEKDDKTSETPSAEVVAKARHAYELLESWRFVPGSQARGIDAGVLNAWVDKARELCRERGYSSRGDHYIGQILAYSPSGTDDTWPQMTVCNLIERLESDQVERGLYIGRLNSRGMTKRAPEEGGQQEPELVAKYCRFAEALAASFPRTSRVLRKIASNFDRDAKREDIESVLSEYD